MELFEAILIGTGFGLVGGITKTALVGGRFTTPRKFTDHNGDTHFLYGSMSELFLGIVAGAAAVLPYYSQLSLGYAMYISFVSGVGGSSFINSMMNKRLADKKQDVKEKLNQYDVQ
ncbi:hypothetical protein ACFFIX_14205 [Metabacillus herbersteinensis]|uniref:DUF4257 domain-containing protein n=1 Tax=Metabacillus herbersteinensis TaxID=283816 RepID=A0ABV6GFY0_9BACI